MDGLGEALRTTGEGWREGAGFGGRCWIGWMVIGEEDGSDSFSDDRGSDDSSGWRLRGWAASAARGEEWAWSRLGTLGLDAPQGGSVRSRARGRWGVSRERRGWQSGGETQEEGLGAWPREGGSGTRREREFWLGRGRRGGRVSSGRRGVARTRERRRPQQRRRGRQDRTGTGSDSIRGGDGIGGFCDTDSNDDRDGEDRDSDDDSRGRGLSVETWARFDRAFERWVRDEVRDRGQQQRQGRRQQLQRRGRQLTASATTRNSDDSEDRDSNDSDGDSGGDGEL